MKVELVTTLKRQATRILDRVGITANKNLIPYDPRPATEASGIRLGTPTLTTRGMKEPEMEIVARLIVNVLKNPVDAENFEKTAKKVRDLCDVYPLYPNDILKQEAV